MNCVAWSRGAGPQKCQIVHKPGGDPLLIDKLKLINSQILGWLTECFFFFFLQDDSLFIYSEN